MTVRDVTLLTVEQLRDLIVLSDDIIAVMTAAEELRRRDVPLAVPLGRAWRNVR